MKPTQRSQGLRRPPDRHDANTHTCTHTYTNIMKGMEEPMMSAKVKGMHVQWGPTMQMSGHSVAPALHLYSCTELPFLIPQQHMFAALQSLSSSMPSYMHPPRRAPHTRAHTRAPDTDTHTSPALHEDFPQLSKNNNEARMHIRTLTHNHNKTRMHTHTHRTKHRMNLMTLSSNTVHLLRAKNALTAMERGSGETLTGQRGLCVYMRISMCVRALVCMRIGVCVRASACVCVNQGVCVFTA